MHSGAVYAPRSTSCAARGGARQRGAGNHSSVAARHGSGGWTRRAAASLGQEGHGRSVAGGQVGPGWAGATPLGARMRVRYTGCQLLSGSQPLPPKLSSNIHAPPCSFTCTPQASAAAAGSPVRGASAPVAAGAAQTAGQRRCQGGRAFTQTCPTPEKVRHVPPRYLPPLCISHVCRSTTGGGRRPDASGACIMPSDRFNRVLILAATCSRTSTEGPLQKALYRASRGSGRGRGAPSSCWSAARSAPAAPLVPEGSYLDPLRHGNHGMPGPRSACTRGTGPRCLAAAEAPGLACRSSAQGGGARGPRARGAVRHDGKRVDGHHARSCSVVRAPNVGPVPLIPHPWRRRQRAAWSGLPGRR